MRKLLVALGAAMTATASPAQPIQPPKLVVEISVDGLSSEAFERSRPHFAGGLARLSGGTVFPDAVVPAEPASSGIASLVQQRLSQATAVSVAGDRSSVVGTAGAVPPDQRWYWEGTRFASDLRSPVPRTVALANNAVAEMIATAQAPLVPPPACAAQAAPPQSTTRFARAAGDAQAFEDSPALDAAVLALAAGLAQELRLGTDAAPDVLSVELPATARVAQRFGDASEAACLQMLSLDRDLGDFLTLLDRAGLDYAVVLSAAPRSLPPSSEAPILFWRRGMRGPIIGEERVSTGDIAPTVAAMLGLVPPPGMPGRCIAAVPGVACPTR